jgi:hypothetical protein
MADYPDNRAFRGKTVIQEMAYFARDAQIARNGWSIAVWRFFIHKLRKHGRFRDCADFRGNLG